MPLPSFVRSGLSGTEITGKASPFVKVESGKVLEFVALTGVEPPEGEEPTGKNAVLSFKQYTIWLDSEDRVDGAFSPTFIATGEPDDPGVALGLEPKFRAMLLIRLADDTKTRILSLPVSAFKQLTEIETLMGSSIKGLIMRYGKTGDGLRTRYKLISTGRRIDVTEEPELDLMDYIGMSDRDKIIQTLENIGMWPPASSVGFEDEMGKKKGKK
jgi:hypothetical protein